MPINKSGENWSKSMPKTKQPTSVKSATKTGVTATTKRSATSKAAKPKAKR